MGDYLKQPKTNKSQSAFNGYPESISKHNRSTLQRHRTTLGVGFAILFGLIGFTFQNCANDFAFVAADDLNERLAAKSYSTATVGDESNFPPLKLIFVVDNSGTMGVNQINLSNAFDRLFAGENQDNLAPFDTSAIVISTAQYSPGLDESVFSKLPSLPLSYFSALDSAGFSEHRSASLVSGQIAGDLVGFRASRTVDSSLDRTVFEAAPVALLQSDRTGGSIWSTVSRKPRGADVQSFSQEFKERIALLNPNLSAVDPTTNSGVLDPVVDKESGLCALARTLSDNSNLIKPGDLASIVLVSDEDDDDPSGRKCVKEILRGNSSTQYVDGRCETPRTEVGHRRAISNPTPAQCEVRFQDRFSYQLKYQQPRTRVEYSTQESTFLQLRTQINYRTFTQMYDQRRTNVTWYRSERRSAPISTPVQYYTHTRNCVIRDGIETNCVDNYLGPFVVSLPGQLSSGQSCLQFVNNRISAANVFYGSNSPYSPTCSTAVVGTDVAGNCSENDSTRVNCRTVFIAGGPTPLNGVPINGNCQTFAQSRLPSGAIYNDPINAPIACSQATSIANVSGACSTSDPNVENCRTIVSSSASTLTVNRRTPSAEACESTLGALIPTNAVRGSQEFPITCTALSPQPRSGACSPSNPDIENCQITYTRASEPQQVVGTPSSNQTCLQFVNNRLSGSNIVYGNGPVEHQPVCLGPGTPNPSSNQVTGNLNLGSYPSVSVSQNQPCDPAIVADIVRLRNLPVAAGTTPSCTITSLLTNGTPIVYSDSFRDVTCADPSLDWQSVCRDSNGARRNCVASDRPRGATHETNTTWLAAIDGTFTCSSSCAETGACRVGSTVITEGRLEDFYFGCQTRSASPRVESTFTMRPVQDAFCSAGQVLVRNGDPYRTAETQTAYVAGELSDRGEPNALSSFIVEKLNSVLGASRPITSVFVRQPGDPLGVNGSVGANYIQFADQLEGRSLSVLSGPDVYASALQDLSSEVRKRINRTLSFRDMDPELTIRKVWILRKSAPPSQGWGSPVDSSLWSQSGSTLILKEAVQLDFGDQVQIEYW